MSFTQKAAAAAGSFAALSMASQNAEATIIHVDNMPLSLDFTAPDGTEVGWDVDGQFGRDFFLNRNDTYYIDLDSIGANGRGIVNISSASSDDFRNLPLGFLVGPTLTAGYFMGRTGTGVSTRTALISNGTLRSIGGDADGFTSGDPGYIGFAFDADGTTLYGWAELTIDTNAPGTVTISEWAYEDTGAAIAVGDTGPTTAAVPEPHSLALMAMGAAGVAAWRLRRNRNAEKRPSSC